MRSSGQNDPITCSRKLQVSVMSQPRVTLIENFASHAAVQEFVDIKPD